MGSSAVTVLPSGMPQTGTGRVFLARAGIQQKRFWKSERTGLILWMVAKSISDHLTNPGMNKQRFQPWVKVCVCVVQDFFHPQYHPTKLQPGTLRDIEGPHKEGVSIRGLQMPSMLMQWRSNYVELA